MPKPTFTPDPPHERFVMQSEFCRLTGISIPWATRLRKEGILPSFGQRPVYIPLIAGTYALTKYAMPERQSE